LSILDLESGVVEHCVGTIPLDDVGDFDHFALRNSSIQKCGDKAIRGLCAAEFRTECAERQKKTVAQSQCNSGRQKLKVLPFSYALLDSAAKRFCEYDK